MSTAITANGNGDWQSMIQGLSLQEDRRGLPVLSEPFPPIQVWKTIKEAFGSSKLMSMPMPMQLHEPTSELHKRAEEMAYASLLNDAAQEPSGSVERHVKVAAFALSFYQGNVRTTKPTNPVLGETLELVDKRQGFRLLLEEVYQATGKEEVSICAWSAEGRSWKLHGICDPKIRFTMSGCIDILGHTWQDVISFADGETFHFTKVNTRINNLIAGKQYLTAHGEFVIRTLSQPQRSVHLKILEPSMLSSRVKQGQVEGWVVEQEASTKAKAKQVKLPGWRLQGNYHSHLEVSSPDGKIRTLWQATMQPDDPRYGMTSYVLQLNNLTPALKPALPPTDSRFRPDLRLLENGNLPEAEAEYRRLDKLTRSRVINTKSGQGQAHVPKWFEKVETTPDFPLPYRYKGGYWEARNGAGFHDIEQIF